jgi:hypothetical protein
MTASSIAMIVLTATVIRRVRYLLQNLKSAMMVSITMVMGLPTAWTDWTAVRTLPVKKGVAVRIDSRPMLVKRIEATLQRTMLSRLR